MSAEYFVQNLYAVGYLIAEGFKVLRTEKSPKGRTLYYFSDDDMLKTALTKFYEDPILQKYIRGLVEAKVMMKTT